MSRFVNALDFNEFSDTVSFTVSLTERQQAVCYMFLSDAMRRYSFISMSDTEWDNVSKLVDNTLFSLMNEVTVAVSNPTLLFAKFITTPLSAGSIPAGQNVNSNFVVDVACPTEYYLVRITALLKRDSQNFNWGWRNSATGIFSTLIAAQTTTFALYTATTVQAKTASNRAQGSLYWSIIAPHVAYCDNISMQVYSLPESV